MKKSKATKRSLKLNKGRIANLHAGAILGGEDKGGRNKDTKEDCGNTNDCTTTLSGVYTTSNIACPDPSNSGATY